MCQILSAPMCPQELRHQVRESELREALDAISIRPVLYRARGRALCHEKSDPERHRVQRLVQLARYPHPPYANKFKNFSTK